MTDTYAEAAAKYADVPMHRDDEQRLRAGAFMQGAGPFTRPDKFSTFDMGEMPRHRLGTEEDPRLWVQALVNPEHEGLSLLSVRYPPNSTIGLHRHDVPQIAVVIEGEVRQGNRVFKAGTGYYTPAGQAYTITAGPEGVHVIEFRDVPLCFYSDFTVADERAAGRASGQGGTE